MSSDHQHEAELAQAHMANAEQSKTVEELNELVNKLTSQLNLFSAEVRSLLFIQWQIVSEEILSDFSVLVIFKRFKV